MYLSDFSIERPVAAVVTIIGLMALGLLALTHLRVNQIPDVNPPALSIEVPYPGASPETVETDVIDRLEKSLQGIGGVEHITSTAGEGRASITVTFRYGKSVVEAADEVRNAIAAIRYKLPTEMREPLLRHIDPQAQPIMHIALSSNTQSLAELSRYAEDKLTDRLRAIDGVATVNVMGALHRELSVLLKAQKLREYGVSVADVVTALRAQNITAPVGQVHGLLDDVNLRLVGRIAAPADFARIPVKRHGSDLVRLGQIADIADGYADPLDMSERDGVPNVGISIVRSHEAGTVAVADELRRTIEEVNRTLPRGTQLVITYDGGKEAHSSLDNVVDSLLFGAALTVLVVFFFLNSWRSTLITALSLPTSAITAFIAVWLCGFTLNFMTLLGLSLAIGVLIDDAIVVRENIVRHLAAGASRIDAAREGAREIGMAVTATTFSIVAVFFPVAFMPGEAGQWFRPFALTVACSVLVSLFISFTLDPMLSAYWGDPPQEHEGGGVRRVLARCNARFDRWADRYGDVVTWALARPRSMAVAALLSLIAAVAFHIAFGGSSFLPVSDTGKLVIDVRVPSGASLKYAQLKMEKAAQLAKALPETLSTDADIAIGGGRVYVDIGRRGTRRRSAAQIAAELRSRLARVLGVEITVLDDVNMGAQKPVQIQFSGSDSRRLLDIAESFAARLRQVPGAADVGLSEQGPRKELQIALDRNLANNLGISAADAAQALRVAFAGVEAGDWVDPDGEARDVAVRLHPDDRLDIGNIERLPIAVAGTDTMVPLAQIAGLAMGDGPAKIEHVDGKRMISVSANAQGRSAGEVTADALKIARTLNFPPGYGLELGGASRSQQELFGEMATALILGIALMYLILVVQFGSFSVPLSVMLSLPLSMTGVVASLWATGSTLNLMSFIGIIMLMGLVAKNAILLLDCARKREEAGEERRAALAYAGRQRLRPIMMTTCALIAGMLPIAIGLGEGGDFYRPLAIAIIGGTVTSTVLALLVVPTLYNGIESAREEALARYQARARRGSAVVAALMLLLEVALFWVPFKRFAPRGIPSGLP